MGAYLIFDSKTVKPYLPSMAHLIHRYCPSDRIESENRGAGAATYERSTFIPKGMPARGPGSSPAESCSSICLACQARIHLIPLKTREAGSEADLQQSCIYLMWNEASNCLVSHQDLWKETQKPLRIISHTFTLSKCIDKISCAVVSPCLNLSPTFRMTDSPPKHRKTCLWTWRGFSLFCLKMRCSAFRLMKHIREARLRDSS